MLSLSLALLLPMTGCHSAFINATIANHTSSPLSLIEVDYPSASFGTQTLNAGQEFHYRFKILGNGPTAILWTDSAHHDHKLAGPALREGQEGSALIDFTPNAAPQWKLNLVQR
jgi:hypothetical protein